MRTGAGPRAGHPGSSAEKRSIALSRIRCRLINWPVGGLLLALSASGCARGAVGTLYPRGSPPRFEAGSCPVSPPSQYRTECGTLIVPENRRQAATREVRLAVSIIRSRNAAPDKVPALFLPGGPGEPCLDGLARVADEAEVVLAARDLLVMDYRGVGRSQPSLSCDAPGLDPGSPSFLTSCRDTLLERGVDLTAYKTVDVAADLADLVQALGFAKVDLIGNSYGTRVAMTLLRDRAAIVRSAVLDAPVPLDVNVFETLPATAERAFAALFEACARQPACAERYPAVEAQLDAALAAVRARPPELTLRAHGRPDAKLRLTPALLMNLLLQCFAPPLLPALPAIIADAAAGKFDALVPLLQALYERPPAVRMLGTYESVQCAEELPFNSAGGARATMAQHPRFAGLSTFERQARDCANWPRTELDPRDNLPVKTDVPVLLLSGRFDPIVDPGWAEAARRWLPNSRHLVFENGAHGALQLECGWRTAAAFFANPDALAVDSCAENQPPLVFWDDNLVPRVQRALHRALSK
jgi:pimeloyl-ACP methyl ester carboxylesterase